MRFRRDSLFFWEGQIPCIILPFVGLAVLPMLGWQFSLFCLLFSCFFIWINLKQCNEMITIDETGIRCQKSDKQLWAYEWEHIAALKRGSRFRWPSIEVITYDKYGKPEQFALPDHYFLLGRAAKKALRQYHPLKDHSPDQ